MERKQCNVRMLSQHFKFRQVIGDDDSLNRSIEVASTSRPGLELTGFFDHFEPKRVVIIGNKESAYISSLSYDVLYQRFDFLTNALTPMILVTGNNVVPQALNDVAKLKNFPVFVTSASSSDMIVEIVTYLGEKLAMMTSVHGVLMNVFGKGVLITGESGMGKSEVALDLILEGHSLIADDRVDVSRIKDKLIGTAPTLLKGMLEIRGIGIIDVTQMYGVRSFLEQEEIDFVIEFQKWDDNKEYLRAGIEEQLYFETLGVKIPRLIFPVKEGRNLAVLVESGVRDFMLKQRGINTAQLFDERVMDYIKKQNEE